MSSGGRLFQSKTGIRVIPHNILLRFLSMGSMTRVVGVQLFTESCDLKPGVNGGKVQGGMQNGAISCIGTASTTCSFA